MWNGLKKKKNNLIICYFLQHKLHYHIFRKRLNSFKIYGKKPRFRHIYSCKIVQLRCLRHLIGNCDSTCYRIKGNFRNRCAQMRIYFLLKTLESLYRSLLRTNNRNISRISRCGPFPTDLN